MNDKNLAEALQLEVMEVEKATKPGCSGSSSTSPRCTCPVAIADDLDEPEA